MVKIGYTDSHPGADNKTVPMTDDVDDNISERRGNAEST